ncbi:Uncharacterised protein [Vibrio cholerae]|nr:Uncharacterised protein [Vibrio cholerae]CSI80605.1 Uncharacterised protein [Vibrio cholerae]
MATAATGLLFTTQRHLKSLLSGYHFGHRSQCRHHCAFTPPTPNITD